jgi:hypothetical protein
MKRILELSQRMGEFECCEVKEAEIAEQEDLKGEQEELALDEGGDRKLPEEQQHQGEASQQLPHASGKRMLVVVSSPTSGLDPNTGKYDFPVMKRL